MKVTKETSKINIRKDHKKIMMQIPRRMVRKIKDFGFRPYIKSYTIAGIAYKFFFGTKQSSHWYDPPSQSAIIEYEWLIQNINLSKQKIIDGGAHHGHYSVILGMASNDSVIVSVDPLDVNLALTEVNMRLNHLEPKLIKCVIANSEGLINFENISNGKIVSTGGIKVAAKRLSFILPDATIVKLDIEGAEFDVTESQLSEMNSVHTWIIEVHTKYGEPEKLVRSFSDKGYKVNWLNKDKSTIEEYMFGNSWNCHHTTIFAQK